MSYSKILRYRRSYRNFWQACDEFMDLPRRDRADLVYLCDHILDEDGRTPLSGRALTQAMGVGDGADEIIAFCRRCPFVCVYVGPDGKEYAAVPALAILATDKQRSTKEDSVCPAPPDGYTDPAVRMAIATVADNDTVAAAKSSVGRSKQTVGAKPDKNSAPKPDVGASNADDGAGNPHVHAHVHTHVHTRVHDRAPDTLARARPLPNPTQPNKTADACAPRCPETNAGSPPARAPIAHTHMSAPATPPLDPRAISARDQWLAQLRILSPASCIADATVDAIAREYAVEAFVAGVERHLGDDPRWWQRQPIAALRTRCQWAAERPPTPAAAAPGPTPPPRNPLLATSTPRIAQKRQVYWLIGTPQARAYLVPSPTPEAVEAVEGAKVHIVEAGEDESEGGRFVRFRELDHADQEALRERFRDVIAEEDRKAEERRAKALAAAGARR